MAKSKLQYTINTRDLTIRFAGASFVVRLTDPDLIASMPELLEETADWLAEDMRKATASEAERVLNDGNNDGSWQVDEDGCDDAYMGVQE